MDRVADIKRQAQNYVRQGQWEDAIRAYEKLTQDTDADPYVWVLIGDVHARRGDDGASGDAYRRAVQGYRDTGLLKNAVAVAKKLLRTTRARSEVLEILAELSAQDGLAGDSAAYYAAAADEKVIGGDHEAAVTLLQRGVAVSPMHADCSNRLVDLLVDLGRPQDAARELLRLSEALRLAGREDPVPFLVERAKALDPEAELPVVEAPASSAGTAAGREAISGLRAALQPLAAEEPPKAAASAPGAKAAPERLSGLESTGLQRAPAEAEPVSAASEAVLADSPSKPAEEPERKIEPQVVQAAQVMQPPQAAQAPPPAPAAASGAPAGVPEEAPAAEPEPAVESAAQAPEEQAAAEPREAHPSAGEAEPAAQQEQEPAPFVEPKATAGPRSTRRAVSVKDEAPGPGPLIDLSKILDEFKQGLEQQIAPDDAKSHYDMAMAFMEMNLLGDAVAELAAASHDPELRPRCCELLGQCYLRQHLPQDAERVLRRGLESANLTEEAQLSLRYHLGLALGELGQHAEAHDQLETVVRTRPDFMDAAVHLERLRRRAS